MVGSISPFLALDEIGMRRWVSSRSQEGVMGLSGFVAIETWYVEAWYGMELVKEAQPRDIRTIKDFILAVFMSLKSVCRDST